MAERKIKIKRIENPTTRQVTFSKRRGGLFKKAHDLAVLCDAEVGVIIFSSKGKLFQFANPSMRSVVERYSKTCGDAKKADNVATEQFSHVSDKLTSFLSTLTGDNLEQLSLKDLLQIEQQIHSSLCHIHSKKEQLLLNHVEDLREEVTKTRRTTNANLNILEKLLDTGSGNLRGQGGFERSCLQETPQTDASLSLRAKARDDLTCEGLLPAAKRFLITEDLNKSPAPTDE